MDNREKEISLLKVSAGLTVAFAILGVLMAVGTDSMSLLIDGLYGVADMIISIAAVFVVRKIHAPPDKNYHFGYAKLEPFLTGLNGTLILCLCGCTILTSVQDIMHPEPVRHLYLIIVYSFISMLICVFFGVYMRRCGRVWRSEVLLVDSHLWVTEAIISAAICLAFGFGLLTGKSETWEKYTNYIDPVTCILISFFLISQPARIIWGSFKDMLDACPEDDVKDRITGLLDGCSRGYSIGPMDWMRLRKAGRRLFLTACFTVPEDQNMKKMSSIRDEIVKKIKLSEPDIDVCIVFSNKL